MPHFCIPFYANYTILATQRGAHGTMAPSKYAPAQMFCHCLSFIFTYNENFRFLVQAVKIFEFWKTRLRRTPILIPTNFVIS